MNDAKRIYRYFWLSIMIKGLISLLEIIAGLAALALKPGQLDSIITLFAQELYENPQSLLGSHLIPLIHSVSAQLQIFLGIYLLSRGAIKLGLIIALLKNKVWAYPLSLIVLGLFILFQTYEIIVQHSVVNIFLTIFDLIVVYFIYREYQIVKVAVTHKKT